MYSRLSTKKKQELERCLLSFIKRLKQIDISTDRTCYAKIQKNFLKHLKTRWVLFTGSHFIFKDIKT